MIIIQIIFCSFAYRVSIFSSLLCSWYYDDDEEWRSTFDDDDRRFDNVSHKTHKYDVL